MKKGKKEVKIFEELFFENKDNLSEEELIKLVEDENVEIKSRAQVESEERFNPEDVFDAEDLMVAYDAVLFYDYKDGYAVVMDMQNLRIYSKKEDGLFKVVDYEPYKLEGITIISGFELMMKAQDYLFSYKKFMNKVAEGALHDV